MTVKNQVRTVRGLFVNRDATVGAEKFVFDGDSTDCFDTLNSRIGADHGKVIVVQENILIWVSEDTKNTNDNINIKLSLMTGQAIYGNGVLIGYESTEDDLGSRFVDLPSSVYDHLVGH